MEHVDLFELGPILLLACFIVLVQMRTFLQSLWSSWTRSAVVSSGVESKWSDPVSYGNWSGKKEFFPMSDGSMKAFYTNEFGEPMDDVYAQEVVNQFYTL